jgi:hypothetical protein
MATDAATSPLLFSLLFFFFSLLFFSLTLIPSLFSFPLLPFSSPSFPLPLPFSSHTRFCCSEAWFDNRDLMATDAGYNLAILLVVIFLLTAGNLLIIRDATRMVIGPMERVLAVLKQVCSKRKIEGERGENRAERGGRGEKIGAPSSYSSSPRATSSSFATRRAWS